MKLTKEQRSIVTVYGHLFNNTGGNDVLELIEREGVNDINNPLIAELQGCSYAQVLLIQSLSEGELIHATV